MFKIIERSKNQALNAILSKRKEHRSGIGAKFKLKLSGEIAPNTQSVSEFILTRLTRLAFWHKMHL